MNAADYLLSNCRKLDKNFIAGEKEQLSWLSLLKKVNGLSAFISHKVGSGREIMLLSENNIFFIICYLSIIKSRNTAVLTQTRASKEDLEFIFKKCSLSAIFTQEKFKHKVDGIFKKNVFTESVLENLSQNATEKVAKKTGDKSTALIIFTSGSTGEKKGVMISHKNIIANTESIIEYLGLSENDRVEAVLPFYYSYGLSLLNTHLRAGASMVLNNSIFLGSAINEIKKYKCTGFAGVPSTYQILMEKTDFLKEKFPSIRYFTQAGGKLADKFISEIIESFPEKLFFVMYGATEATARLSFLEPKYVKEKMGSVGKGIKNVKLLVLNRHGKQVKPGETGQVVAKGPNIMKGYYKNAKATKKALRNGKFYTGDLATVDKDGYIYILGRSDNMIKSAGHKVFPNEVEKVINCVKGVKDSFVFGLPDDILGQATVAAVLVENPSESLKKEILLFCREKMPYYKIPKHIVFFSQFPLNSSNKKDLLKIKEWTKQQIH